MPDKKRFIGIAVINVLLFFVLIILYSADTVNISIKNATPMLLLPLITAFSSFSDIKFSAIAGLVTGICLDSISSSTFCFNAVVIMLLSVAVYLLSNNVFNKNILAVATMSLIVCVTYFVIYWLVFCLFTLNIKDSISYLFGRSIPSAVYSAVFIFPFYYLYRYFYRVKEQ